MVGTNAHSHHSHATSASRRAPPNVGVQLATLIFAISFSIVVYDRFTHFHDSPEAHPLTTAAISEEGGENDHLPTGQSQNTSSTTKDYAAFSIEQRADIVKDFLNVLSSHRQQVAENEELTKMDDVTEQQLAQDEVVDVHVVAHSSFLHAKGTKQRQGTCNMLVSAAMNGYKSVTLIGERSMFKSRTTVSAFRKEMVSLLAPVNSAMKSEGKSSDAADQTVDRVTLEDSKKQPKQKKHRGFPLNASNNDLIVYVDLHDVVFTSPAQTLLDRYQAPPLLSPQILLQGDVNLYASSKAARRSNLARYASWYNNATANHNHNTGHDSSSFSSNVTSSTDDRLLTTKDALEMGMESGLLFPFPNAGTIIGTKKNMLEILVGDLLASTTTSAPSPTSTTPTPSQEDVEQAIASNALKKGLLQSGRVVIDVWGSVSQNINTNVSFERAAAADTPQNHVRPYFPRNGRVFKTLPNCSINTLESFPVQYHLSCEENSGRLAPSSKRAPIWHFSGKSKGEVMRHTLPYLHELQRAHSDAVLLKSMNITIVDKDGAFRLVALDDLCG